MFAATNSQVYAVNALVGKRVQIEYWLNNRTNGPSSAGKGRIMSVNKEFIKVYLDANLDLQVYWPSVINLSVEETRLVPVMVALNGVVA